MKFFFFSSTSRTEPSLSIFKPLWVLLPSRGFDCRLLACNLSTLSNPKAKCSRGCNRCSTWELYGGTDGLTTSEVKFTYDSPHVTWRTRRDPIKSRSGKVQQLLRKKTFLWAFLSDIACVLIKDWKHRFRFYLFLFPHIQLSTSRTLVWSEEV